MKFESLKNKKRGVILSPDICGDCDDVGAIALLHRYADEAGFPILGICNCTSSRDGTKTVYALNRHFERPNIPLGEYKKHTLHISAETSKYTGEIAKRFGEGAPEPQAAAEFYRNILSKAEDDSVVIITIGFLTDIAELMKSDADEYSPLTGIELMKKKVSHVVSMALKYPLGIEFNIKYAPAEAKFFFDNCPVDIFITDFNLGQGLRTGFDPADKERLADNPVFESYRLFSDAYGLQCDNNSYDLTAVQFAYEGEGLYYRINPQAYAIEFYTDTDRWGTYENGATKFIPTDCGHVYLLEATDKDLIRDELNKRSAQ